MPRTRPRRLDWRPASSLEDLGELTARYLSGETSVSPTYGGPPNAETAEILEPLLALNRAGFVTDMSQPACRDGGWVQRAAVVGFCSGGLAARLAYACARAGLGTVVFAPSERPARRTSYAVQVPVTTRNGRRYTGVGVALSMRELRRLWGGELSAAGMGALLGAHQFTAYDPEWGREGLLWDTLLGALS